MKFNKKIFIVSLVGFILGIMTFLFFNNNTNTTNPNEVDLDTKVIDLELVKSSYSDFVSLIDKSCIYEKVEDKYSVVSTVNGSIEVSLDNSYEIVNEYLKILDSDYFVKYDSFIKLDSLSNLEGEYKYYRNYIPYNENIILNDNAKLYVDEINYYEVDGGNYPIIIKNNDKYGIEYNNRLVYVNNTDVKEVINSNNSGNEVANGVSVLNYHFVVSGSNENGELDECKQSICITDNMFDSHIKYLADNGYYGVSIRDLELFIDNKIQLPSKSVSITIDDGWYVVRSIKILEKYQILGTLFLIGSLASPNDYISNYLEIHSHTWNMHGLKTGDDCPNSNFRGGITCFDEEKILDDLRKSRESLNNTTYFCYPFYDYNDRAIELLKKAGFTMAFAGQTGDKARVGTNKYKIPRYVISNYTTMNTFIKYVS